MHTGLSRIQQPWVKGSIKGLGGLTCYRVSNAVRSRACVVSKGLNAVSLCAFSTGYLTAVSLNLENIGKIIVAAANFPYDSPNIPPEEVVWLVEYCQ